MNEILEKILFFFIRYVKEKNIEYIFYLEMLINKNINCYFNFHWMYFIKFYQIFNPFLEKFYCLDMKQFILKWNVTGI